VRRREWQEKELGEGRMIGGLLRFAPGRLGARQDRAPAWCAIPWRAVSWLPCVSPETSWNPSPRKDTGSVRCLDRGGNRQREERMRQPWLAEMRRVQGSLVSAVDVKDVGWRWGRDARLRLWPCPSPSRICDRYAAPAASTASLRHGIGRRDRQAESLPQVGAAQPSRQAGFS